MNFSLLIDHVERPADRSGSGWHRSSRSNVASACLRSIGDAGELHGGIERIDFRAGVPGWRP